jgi:hypothetical protein
MYIQREIYPKELAHAIRKACKPQDLQGESASQRLSKVHNLAQSEYEPENQES